jgi:tripartite-type tricarboxylate transporter receptor subunit TctC
MPVAARLLALLFAACVAAPAWAQPAFPSKPVRIVVPFPPGGATDALARLMADKLAEKWKQPVVVENKPGANTSLGTDVVAKSAPDGHVLGFVTGSHVINPLLTSKLPYDTQKDLTGVSLLTRFHMALYAHPSFGANTPAELIALAKKEPGKVAYGSATTQSYLGMAMLDMMAGTKMSYVPYKGSAQAATDVLGGHTLLMIDPVLASTLEHVKNGKLKLIGTLGPTRRADAERAGLRHRRAGLRLQRRVRPRRARRHAGRAGAAHPRRRRRGDGAARGRRAGPHDRPGGGRLDPRRVQRLHRRRDEEVGAGRQGDRREAGLTRSGYFTARQAPPTAVSTKRARSS